MYLQSIASAFPEYRYTQEECWKAIINFGAGKFLKDRPLKLLEKVLLGGGGIETRHFALPDIEPVFSQDAEALNRTFEAAAPALSQQALEKALSRAGMDVGELDALFICTCTGYLCPGVTSYVAEAMGMRPDVYLADLVGLGCGAAIPLMRSADAYLARNPEAKVAVVAVEVCSAAFYVDDDPGVLISLCLFGDGASASIWTSEGEEGSWKASGFDTVHIPSEREKIRFVNRGGKLCNQLHRAVPGLAAEAVKGLYEKQGKGRVIAHTGGRDVIEAIEREIPGVFLKETREVLRRYGNVSSPSVLLALEDALASGPVEKDFWLTAFGAGFAAHSCHFSRS